MLQLVLHLSCIYTIHMIHVQNNLLIFRMVLDSFEVNLRSSYITVPEYYMKHILNNFWAYLSKTSKISPERVRFKCVNGSVHAEYFGCCVMVMVGWIWSGDVGGSLKYLPGTPYQTGNARPHLVITPTLCQVHQGNAS